MPKAKGKSGGPVPLAGQLTLEQALARAAREKTLPETDDDEPDDTLSSSSPDDDKDEDYRPPRRSASRGKNLL